MEIKTEILSIIESGTTQNNLYFLPNTQLDRKTYLEVNKILVALEE